jgi:protein FAM50
MDKFQPDASDRSSNDNPAQNRFTSQAATAEDLLKAQTVGLVNLNDYRKRRAEALDLKERGVTSTIDSGASTPVEEYGHLSIGHGTHANLQSTEHQRPSLCSRRSAR